MPDQGPHIDGLRREAQARIVVAGQIMDHLLGEHDGELNHEQRTALRAARQRTFDAVNDLERFPAPANLAAGEEPAILRMAQDIANAVPPQDDDEALA